MLSQSRRRFGNFPCVFRCSRENTGISVTTNAAYGGPDRRTLYITESETGTILSARLEVPGKEMYSHV